VANYDERTALVVVDVQNDFADPSGTLYVDEGEHVVPVVNAEIAEAVSAGALIVYTQDWHPPETPHFQNAGGIWPVHCVEDTWGAEFHPDLAIAGGEIVRKGHERGDGYSAFSVRDVASGHTWSTALERILDDREISRIVVVGLATDFCVVETVCDARVLGLPVQVVLAGIRPVELVEGAGAHAISRMRDAGAEIV
jgi:nicotinamidase/pyrazinamidase